MSRAALDVTKSDLPQLRSDRAAPPKQKVRSAATPATAVLARVIHSVPGRVRFHLPGWSGTDDSLLEDRIRGLAGVERVKASALTGNVLVHFDPSKTDVERVRLAASLGATEATGAGGPRPAGDVGEAMERRAAASDGPGGPMIAADRNPGILSRENPPPWRRPGAVASTASLRLAAPGCSRTEAKRGSIFARLLRFLHFIRTAWTHLARVSGSQPITLLVAAGKLTAVMGSIASGMGSPATLLAGLEVMILLGEIHSLCLA